MESAVGPLAKCEPHTLTTTDSDAKNERIARSPPSAVEVGDEIVVK